MSVIAYAEITVYRNIDVSATYRYYYTSTSSTKPSAPTIAYASGASPSGWSTTEPAVDISKYLYFVDLTIYSNAATSGALASGTYKYSEVSLSSSYEAAKEAYSKAETTGDAVDTIQTRIDSGEFSDVRINVITSLLGDNKVQLTAVVMKGFTQITDQTGLPDDEYLQWFRNDEVIEEATNAFSLIVSLTDGTNYTCRLMTSSDTGPSISDGAVVFNNASVFAVQDGKLCVTYQK